MCACFTAVDSPSALKESESFLSLLKSTGWKTEYLQMNARGWRGRKMEESDERFGFADNDAMPGRIDCI